MLFLLILLVVCIGFTYLACKANERNFDFLMLVSGLLAAISGIVFLIAVVGIPLSRMEDRAQIAKYHELGETVRRARQKGTLTDLERAAIQQKIAEFNCWRAETQYWNSTIFDIWNLDEVNDLKPLE